MAGSSLSKSIQPLVSVIIPTHNYGQYIGETLASVRAQTYQNWECLVVDDGSTDNTAQVLARYAKLDQRIKYIYQPNQRQSVAKNNGIEHSIGEYIQFLDADDLIEPRKLEQQVLYLEHHEEADIVYGGARYFSTENPQERLYSMWGENTPWMPEVSGRGGEVLLALVEGNIMVISAALVRRSTIDDVGFFDEALPPAEDWEYWVRCAARGKYFAYQDFPESLSLIRSHPDSSSRDGRRRCAVILLARKKIKRILADTEAQKINRRMLAIDEAHMGFEEVKYGSLARGVYHILKAGYLDQRFKYRMKWFVCALSAPFVSKEQIVKLPSLSLTQSLRGMWAKSK